MREGKWKKGREVGRREGRWSERGKVEKEREDGGREGRWRKRGKSEGEKIVDRGREEEIE